MQKEGVRWLNNLVAELVNLRSLPSQPRVDRTFNHPRDGWLLLRSTFAGNGRVWVGIDAGTREEAVIVQSLELR